jgi:hypothetical protein
VTSSSGARYRAHGENFRVCGADKVWAQLTREGISVVRGTVERLMRRLGLREWCAASDSAPPSPTLQGSGDEISSTASSKCRHRTGCG